MVTNYPQSFKSATNSSRKINDNPAYKNNQRYQPEYVSDHNLQIYYDCKKTTNFSQNCSRNNLVTFAHPSAISSQKGSSVSAPINESNISSDRVEIGGATTLKSSIYGGTGFFGLKQQQKQILNGGISRNSIQSTKRS